MCRKADIAAMLTALAIMLTVQILVPTVAFAAAKQQKSAVGNAVVVASLQDPVTVIMPMVVMSAAGNSVVGNPVVGNPVVGNTATAGAKSGTARVSVPLAQPVSAASNLVLSPRVQDAPINLSVDSFQIIGRSSPPIALRDKLLPGTVEYTAQPLPQRKSTKNQNAELAPMLKSTTNGDDPNAKGSFLDKHAVGFEFKSNF